MTSNVPLRIRTAASVEADEQAAVNAIHQALSLSDPRLLLVFCAPGYDLPKLSKELSAAFPAVPMAGCTTLGHVGEEGYTNGGIRVLALQGDLIARTFEIELNSMADVVPRVAEAVRAMLAEHPDLSAFGLLMVDGLSTLEEQLSSMLYRHLPQVPVVGGSASGHNDAQETHVFAGTQFRPRCAAFTLIQTATPFRAMKFAHFAPTAEPLVVTESEPQRRLIRELNGEPAALVYARITGIPVEELNPAVFSPRPFILEMGGEHYVRAIGKANPDHSLLLFCVVEDGVILSVAKAVDPEETARDAFQKIRAAIGPPSLVIGFDCISRRQQFEDTGLVKRMESILRENHVFGFSTFGEQHDGMHMNQTFTGIAFGGHHDVA